MPGPTPPQITSPSPTGRGRRSRTPTATAHRCWSAPTAPAPPRRGWLTCAGCATSTAWTCAFSDGVHRLRAATLTATTRQLTEPLVWVLLPIVASTVYRAHDDAVESNARRVLPASTPVSATPMPRLAPSSSGRSPLTATGYRLPASRRGRGRDRSSDWHRNPCAIDERFARRDRRDPRRGGNPARPRVFGALESAGYSGRYDLELVAGPLAEDSIATRRWSVPSRVSKRDGRRPDSTTTPGPELARSIVPSATRRSEANYLQEGRCLAQTAGLHCVGHKAPVRRRT